ncbi:uncharacterized protein LY89DRAFT_739310 [Mollisia scopiformis]|uniref:Xylanolytic transcriptional activator regulatory domain-containing protein n=1 Tax=Mollisia scopiformis TaxID=149040 RepID=A0A194WTT6_MOLSC|nr:uncharacterized protein LY89DRAFT_739310 [Mollisia scopiformis]KUJ11099.1 hypothetical protein LY89DRAFT_739310 [Mollisia scopiformis]
MPTYRFLHRATAEAWLKRVCDENENRVNNEAPLSNAKVALVLLILATATLYGEDAVGTLHDAEADDGAQSGIFFAAAEHRLSIESGPIRLESVQARLATSMYLLGSSRINQAWYTFGTTSQMILALGLHRKRFTQSHATSFNLVEVEIRKRIFWSAYTLDKYLSVILGRPRIFRDEDIDQQLPERINDSDLTNTVAKSRSTHNQCVSDGPVLHAKLARIVGKISSDLYPTTTTSNTKWVEVAQQRTAELKAWKESLPAFLEPEKVDPSMLIPIFQRQSSVLRLAYLHALILANRPSILKNFADLSRPQDPLTGEMEDRLKECIDAAVLVVETVNGFIEESRMRKPYWFTHYIAFCAISTLYVYAIQNAQRSGLSEDKSVPPTHLRYFEAAERCQRGIYGTTAPSSPFRRYNIILDELKKEVALRLHPRSGFPNLVDVNNSNPPVRTQVAKAPYMMDSSGGTPNRTPSSYESYPIANPAGEQQDYQGSLSRALYSQGNASMNHGAPTAIYDENTMMQLSMFGANDELGWAEFDSCVSML